MSFKNTTEELQRNITLLCPTCGSDDFAYNETSSDEASPITCQSCQRTFTKEELIEENNETIDAHVQDVRKDLVKSIESHFKNLFK